MTFQDTAAMSREHMRKVQTQTHETQRKADKKAFEFSTKRDRSEAL